MNVVLALVSTCCPRVLKFSVTELLISKYREG